MAQGNSPNWPKPVFELSAHEAAIKEQLLQLQDEYYTGLMGRVQAQGHVAVERLSKAAQQPSYRSLEIGCGSGYHFNFVRDGDHVGLDHSEEHLQRARARFPQVRFIRGDAYSLPFSDAWFDRVVSVYVFEHLHRLPECLAEIRRVLKPGGELLVGLPCEGGFAFGLGRRLTSKRYFERKFQVDYLRLVQSEHCNSCREVLDELARWFRVETTRYLPFRAPSVHVNAVVAARCTIPSDQGTGEDCMRFGKRAHRQSA